MVRRSTGRNDAEGKSSAASAVSAAPAPLVAPAVVPPVVPAGPEEKKRFTRIVWLLFDALDVDAVTWLRPKDLELPSFDRFAKEAVFFPDAREPGGRTIRAIPSLMLGKRLSEAKVTKDGILSLTPFDGSIPAPTWDREGPTLFRELAELGARTALVGFHHPYCRLFGDYLSECKLLAMGAVQVYPGSSVSEVARIHLRSILPLVRRRSAIDTLNIIERFTKQQIENSDFDFLYAHFSVPHQPQIYDRSKGDFALLNFALQGYFDNVALADRVFGGLRRAMEEAGIWDDSAVFVTSDHGWGDLRIWPGNLPRRAMLMVKLPQQSDGAVFQARFETIFMKTLVGKILRGEIHTKEELIETAGKLMASCKPEDGCLLN